MKNLLWALALGVTACNSGGGNSIRQTPAPTLQAAPEVTLTPPIDVGGIPHGRLDSVLTVTLDIDAPEGLDADATTVTVTGVPLQRTDDGVWSRTLDGTEGEGIKLLDVVLVDDLGQQVRISEDEDGAPLAQVGFDFTPPRADCTLSPPVANASEAVTLTLNASEDLAAPPSLVFTPATIDPGTPEQAGRTTTWTLDFPAGEDVPYTFVATATDPVGNAQEGDSLCASSDREGTRLGKVPVILGDEVVVAAEPSERVGGIPWAREGADVTVTLPTSEPVSTTASIVTLSGLVLQHRQDQTWGVVLTGGEGDGPKSLDARLFDEAGNTAREQRTDVIQFDFTPPTATCVITPNPANGTDAMVLEVRASEPLQSAPIPTSSDARVLVGAPQIDGNFYRYTLSLAQPDDVPFTLTLPALDRAGNAPDGGSLCPEASRQGQLLTVGPTLSGPVEVQATPSVDVDDVPWVREGAEISVVIPTSEPVDPTRSTVTLSGTDMTWDPGASAWTLDVSSTQGDGPKDLQVHLEDEAGNPLDTRLNEVVRFDFTPPGADCVLAPVLANAGDETITLSVFPSETLSDEGPQVSVDQPGFTVDDPVRTGLGWEIDLTPPADTNVPTYALTVQATDRVGNPQPDASLCDVDTRTGAYFGVLPEPDGDPSLFVSPSVDDDGTPRAKAGALVVLNLPTVDPIDPDRSFVSLSGHVLTSSDGVTWNGVVNAALGDGPKSLFATLVDAAGNVREVQRPDVGYIADFTPPAVATAVLSRSPFRSQALGDDTIHVTLSDPRAGPISVDARVFPTEALGTPPTLTVSPDPGLDFGPPEAIGNAHRWSLAEVPAGQDGEYTLSVVLQDRVGNLSDPLPLDTTITVDTVGPQPPDAVTPQSIEQIRAPWGQVGGGPDVFAVVGQPGSVIPGTTVILINPAGVPQGDATAQADGSFTAFYQADVADLYVAQTDEAGNLSPFARVRNVTWTAALGGKVVGSDLTNPHEFVEITKFEDRIEVPRGVRTFLAETDRETTAAPPWIKRSFATDDDQPRCESAVMAFDHARGEAVLFEEINEGSDTWTWDGEKWTRLDPEDAPKPRVASAMAYDSRRGVMVLSGGYGAFLANDTWEWDGETWTEIPEAGAPSNGDHAMAYDSARNVMVYVGGAFDNGELDVRERDDGSWQRIFSTGQAPWPDARSSMTLVYDERRDVTIMFGGRANGTTVDELWEYDGTTWTPRTIDGPSPTARTDHTAFYHRGIGVMIVIGGVAEDGSELHDMWAWTGDSWDELEGLPDGTITRAGCAAYDTTRDELLFMRDETWTTPHFGEWLNRSSQPSPEARNGHVMGYDPVREEVVLFGGTRRTNSSELLGDMWTWDGTSWTERTPGTMPVGRVEASMAWDDTNDRLLMFGGFIDDGFREQSELWEWNGTTWIDRSPTARPEQRSQMAVAWDPLRERLVMYAGRYRDLGFPEHVAGDLWEWNGSSWTGPLDDPDDGTLWPDGRLNPRMTWDPILQEVVMTLGATVSPPWSNQVWSWDGSDWTNHTSFPAPSARGKHMTTWDPVRQGHIVFGGEPINSTSNGTWLWRDDDGWALMPTAQSPPERAAGGLAYDEARAELVLFGGDRGGVLGDTWVLSSESQDRPGHRLDVDFSRAGVPDAQLQSVTVLWTAGGDGHGDEGPRAGVELLFWDEGQWRIIEDNEAPSSDPEAMCVRISRPGVPTFADGCRSVVDQGALDRLFALGESRESHFAVRPVAGIGSESATVRTTEAAAVVRYQLQPTSLVCERDGKVDDDADGRCDDDPEEICFGDDATGDDDGDGICGDRDLCVGDDATGDDDDDGVCGDLDLCWGPDAEGDADTDGICDDATVITAWTFEGCPGDWTGSGAWACGTPTTEPPPFEGDDVFGTNLTGPPSQDAGWAFEDQTLVSPEITLQPGDNLLAMNVWWDLGPGDGAIVAFQPQGDPQAYLWAGSLAYDTSILGLQAWSGDASDAGWRRVEFPLELQTPLTLRIVVLVATDAVDDSLGLYIDDIVVANRPAD